MEKPVYVSIPLGLNFESIGDEVPTHNSRERNYVLNDDQFSTIATTFRTSRSNDYSPSQSQLTRGISQLSLSQSVATFRRDHVNADLSHTIRLPSNENSLLWSMQPCFSLASDTSYHHQLGDPLSLNTVKLRGNNDFSHTPVSGSSPEANFSFFTWNEPDLDMERTNLSELRSYQPSNPIENFVAAQNQNNVDSDLILTDGIKTTRPLNRSIYTPYKCSVCPCEFMFYENLDVHMTEHYRTDDQTNKITSSDSASSCMNSDSPMMHSQFTWNIEDVAGTQASSSNSTGEASSEDSQKEDMAREQAFLLAKNAENIGQPAANLATEDAVSSIIKSIKD